MNESTVLVIHVRYKNVNEVLASRSENFLKFFSIKYQFIIFKKKKQRWLERRSLELGVVHTGDPR